MDSGWHGGNTARSPEQRSEVAPTWEYNTSALDSIIKPLRFRQPITIMATFTISLAQRRHFDEEGYIVLKATEHKAVDPRTLQSWTDEVSNLPREKGKWMPYDEITSTGERQLMRTENFAPYHSGFNSLLFGDAIRSILAQVTDHEMLLFKDKINYKLPGGNGFQAHLDAPAYDHIGRIEHTTANLAVDAATIANGCVEVVPGSHRMDVTLAHGGKIAREWEGAQGWIPVELEAGDLLIFGSHLAHRSASNKTDEARRSVYATYARASDGRDLRDKYYADRRENFPPDHGIFSCRRNAFSSRLANVSGRANTGQRLWGRCC